MMRWGSFSFICLCTFRKALCDISDEFMDLPIKESLLPSSEETSVAVTDHHSIVILFLILMMIWAINYVWGLGRNTIIVDHWVAHNVDFLNNLFAYIGPGATPSELGDAQSSRLYFIESATQMRLFLSGREGYIGVSVFMKMRPRQDILQSLLRLVVPLHDTITFEAVLTDKPGGWDPASLILCRKGIIAAIFQAHPPIKELTSLVFVPELRLHSDFFLYAEGVESAKDVLQGIALAIAARPDLLDEIVITDRNVRTCVGFEGAPTRIVRVRLRLPSKANLSDLSPLVEATLSFMDHVSQLRLGPSAKARAVKGRAAITEREERRIVEQKQSEAATLKSKRLIRAKELERERYDALSVEAKLKYDEAEQKRLKKESLAKFKPKRK